MRCLGGDETEECQKAESECAHRHALGFGDRGVEGGEKQRPRDSEQERAGQDSQDDREVDVGGAEPED